MNKEYNEMEKKSDIDEYASYSDYQDRASVEGEKGLTDANNNRQDRNSPPKIIHAIAIVYLLIAILQILVQSDQIKGLILYSEWNFGVFMSVFPIILAPIASILFWIRKKIGWILLFIYVAFALMGMLWMLFITLNPMFLFVSLFFSATLWILCQERICNVYKISVSIMYGTILASILIVGAILGVYFFVL